MRPDTRLYDLLPALYKMRDTALALAQLSPSQLNAILAAGGIPENEAHGPLKSLLAIIADQVAVLEENLDQLYDDQFIETCAEWVVPYIGQLVGSRDLIRIPEATVSQRSEVANTISYRRRKGTASVIEQLARDVTGWNANVVEYFQQLATTQYMNHIRPGNLAFTGVNKWEVREYAGTPFDRMTRTADVRHISNGRGKYNIPNIGIFLWRLNSYTLEKTPAHKVFDRCYTFDPLGASRAVFSHPVPEKEITHLAEPQNVPMPISSRILDRYLDQYYGPGKSLLIYKDGVEITHPDTAHEIVCICDLSDITDALGQPVAWKHMPQHKIAVDPTLGRIAFPADAPAPTTVHTDYYYAFSSDTGGGGYERKQTFTLQYDALRTVPGDAATIDGAFNLLLNDLNDAQKNTGVIEIDDNEIYTENLTLAIPSGKTIEIRAANKKRPILRTNAGIQVTAASDTHLILNGLLLEGGGIINNNVSNLGALSVSHCTIVPRTGILMSSPLLVTSLPGIMVNSDATVVSIDKSITGALYVSENASVKVKDSIIDACAPAYAAYSGVGAQDTAGAPLRAENCTFIGKIHTRIMEYVSNCIFFAAPAYDGSGKDSVKADRLQEGCTRFSWAPFGARLPRPYRCQPISNSELKNDSWVKPVFNSTRYGDPDYCQLHLLCAPEITRGADDESEMGAFYHLHTPQRINNLRTRLNEYLRFGLEAGIFFAT